MTRETGFRSAGVAILPSAPKSFDGGHGRGGDFIGLAGRESKIVTLQE
jgi:hypothetical protein